MSDIPDNAPSPRLCIIVKWPDFDGYGFNLHAEKSKPGQYIGKVDANSPAEMAGLLEGDRIIEVNGVNIANENHKQVVSRIKAVPNETKLLVVDSAADKYYKNKNIVVRGTQSNVIIKSSARNQKTPTPEAHHPATNGHREEVDNRSVSSAESSNATSEASTQPQPAAAVSEEPVNSTPEVAPVEEANRSRSPSPPPHHDSEPETEPEPKIEPEATNHEVESLPEVSSEKEEKEEMHSPPEDDRSSHGSAHESEHEPEREPERELEPELKPERELEPELKPERELEPELKPEDEPEHKPEAGIEETSSEEDKSEKPALISPEAESDLEAEYDNVDIGNGRAGGNAAPTSAPAPAPAPVSAPMQRSSSTSSHGSHSSHGSSTAQSPMSTSPTPPPSLEPTPAPAPAPAPTPTPKPTAPPPSVASNNNYNSSGLNLNMSAAEMRAMLARKKKADPRKDTVDLKKKYEIIQNM